MAHLECEERKQEIESLLIHRFPEELTGDLSEAEVKHNFRSKNRYFREGQYGEAALVLVDVDYGEPGIVPTSPKFIRTLDGRLWENIGDSYTLCADQSTDPKEYIAQVQ